MSSTVIIKPTHGCNLACEYCYVGECANSSFMNSKTLENSIEKIIKFQQDKKSDVEFLWHGGEPLLLGIEFYKEVSRLIKYHNSEEKTKVRNSIQTNATLLTDEIIDYLSNPSHYFAIGLSLDGPKEIHNKTRHYKNGAGTFDKVMQAIKLLKNRDKRVGAISVISRSNYQDMDKIYQFFKEEDINLKANPLIFSGRGEENEENLAISPNEYGKAMIKLFDIWFDDPEPNMEMTIDNFDSLVRTKLTQSTYGCNFSHNCQNSFISIGPEGDVYPCGRFDEEEEFKFGNINDDSIDDILKNEKRERLLKRQDSLKSCQSCDHMNLCNGGCMHNAYMKSKDPMTKDYYCTAYKMMFDYIFKRVDAELEQAKGR